MTSRSRIKTQAKNKEHGVALLFCLFALLILTAVTASLVLLSGTETSINYNYRTEEVAFFAAKTGVYEALDRMQASNTNTIKCSIPTGLPGATQPLPAGCVSAPAGVLYIINAGSSLTVQPWNAANPYFDDEFCHEGYSLSGMISTPPDVPCTTVPNVSGWYSTVTSNYPWNSTSAAMPYEWVRINWKQNSSQSYLSGSPSTPTTSYYAVNGTSTTPVCFNGASEVLLSTPTTVPPITPAYTRCEDYQSCGTVSPTVTTPVLMITALAITPNGSRQMVQAEAALTPPTLTVQPCGTNDAYGFFAYGSGFSCSSPAFQIGGNATVDGYNSANGPYNSLTNSNPLAGNIGTDEGLISEGTSTNIGGTVSVPVDSYTVTTGTPPTTTTVVGPGPCPDDYSVSGNPPPPHALAALALPLPVKPTISVPNDTSTTDETSGSISPGSYRNINVSSHGSLTLTAPGTYVVDCITTGSFGSISTSPSAKAITIYVTGTGCASAPITMNSHSTINNASGISENVQILYNGTGTISLQGGPQMCAVVNAPNAAVSFGGGSDFFGTVMANSIDDHGGVNLHFDTADTTLPGASASTAVATLTGSYNILGYHSLPY